MHRNTTEHFSLLPDELLLYLFSFLSSIDIYAILLTSKRTHMIARDNTYWQISYNNHFPHRLEALLKKEKMDFVNWHHEFQLACQDEYDDKKIEAKKRKMKLFFLVKEGDFNKLTQCDIDHRDFQFKDKNKFSLLAWAKKKQFQLIINYFFSKSIEVYHCYKKEDYHKHSHEVLSTAITHHQSLAVFRKLIENGCQPSSSYSNSFSFSSFCFWYQPKKTKHNLLHLAAKEGLIDIAKLLIQTYHFNIDAQDEYGLAALSYAILEDQQEMINYLIESKANPNLRLTQNHPKHKSLIGYDALIHIAVKKRNINAVESLIARGADINSKAAGDYSPLHYASRSGFAEIVSLLITDEANKADIDARSESGMTPLMLATCRQHREVVEILLTNHANTTFTVNFGDERLLEIGDTPLHAATKLGNEEIVKLLLEYEAPPNSKNLLFQTALHCAAEKGNKKIIELLIKNQADTSIKNNQGLTPLDVAEKKGHRHLKELLSDKTGDREKNMHQLR